MSRVTRRLEVQNCRSPSMTFRSSPKGRLSSGRSRRATIAISPPAARSRSPASPSQNNRRVMEILKSEAGLREHAVDRRQRTPLVMPVLQLERREGGDVVSHSRSGGMEAGDEVAEDGIGARNVDALEAVIRLPLL